MSTLETKRVRLSSAIVSGLLAGALLSTLMITLALAIRRAEAPPSALILAVGQHEGNTMFVGVRTGSLWFEQVSDGLVASYSPAFPVPARLGTRTALDGAVYAVVSVDAATDTVRLQQTHGR